MRGSIGQFPRRVVAPRYAVNVRLQPRASALLCSESYTVHRKNYESSSVAVGDAGCQSISQYAEFCCMMLGFSGWVRCHGSARSWLHGTYWMRWRFIISQSRQLTVSVKVIIRRVACPERAAATTVLQLQTNAPPPDARPSVRPSVGRPSLFIRISCLLGSVLQSRSVSPPSFRSRISSDL